MNRLFKKLRLRFFPPIGKQHAIDIARNAAVAEWAPFRVYGRKPPTISVYNLPREPAWFILGPWSDEKEGRMLRSSRLIIVSKTSGDILYDDSANDEG